MVLSVLLSALFALFAIAFDLDCAGSGIEKKAGESIEATRNNEKLRKAASRPGRDARTGGA